MTDETMNLAEEFCSLFISNERSIGRFHPKNGKMETLYEPLKPKDFEAHFKGTHGVGAVPILDDATCYWGAIDIDNHGEDEDTPIGPIDKIVVDNHLPLVICRSKSGGVHAYIFFEEPQPAYKVKSYLGILAEQIGYPKAEIFPKQSELKVSEVNGVRQLGNWINLPYFYIEDTNRYAYRQGKKLNVGEFVSLANKMRMKESDFKALLFKDFAEAPPCIQHMVTQGVESGQRNEAAFHIGIYLRKAYPESVETRMRELNRVIFTKPLPKSELTRTILSAQRPEYGYRCNIDPQHALCDRATCLTRKFGITPGEAEELEAIGSIPEFTELTKFMSEPIRWEMKIDGVLVTNIPTASLLEWRFMREMIAEKLTRIVPMIKNGEWERILSKAMENVRIISTPDEASISGIIRSRLRDFARRADLMSMGQDTKEREAMLRGLPCVQVYDGIRQVMFKSEDFVAYLKRTRSEDLKGVALWFAVRDIGVRHTKVRVGKHNLNVWMFPVEEALKQDESEAMPPEFKTEL